MAWLGDVAPEGRFRPRASITGSSRSAPDATRLPCPPGTEREIVADAVYMVSRAGREGAVREAADARDLGFRAFAGGTALHWAYFAGASRVVALLLAAGADPAVRDPVLGCTGRRNAEGKTALDLARARPEQGGCVAVAEWLAGSAPEPRR